MKMSEGDGQLIYHLLPPQVYRRRCNGETATGYISTRHSIVRQGHELRPRHGAPGSLATSDDETRPNAPKPS